MKKKLTVDDHLRLAAHLRAIRQEMRAIRAVVYGCGLVTQVGTPLYAVETRLRRVKLALDHVLYRDHGDYPHYTAAVYWAADERMRPMANPEPDGATQATRARTGGSPGPVADGFRDLCCEAAAAGRNIAEGVYSEAIFPTQQMPLNGRGRDADD
jgi:hypothetical protein